jgi:ABC-2 type transport system permease protein
MDRTGDVDAVLIVGPEFFDRINELKMSDLLDTENGMLSEGLSALDITLESQNPDSSTHAIVDQFVFADAVRAVGLYTVCNDPFGLRKISARCEEFAAEADQPAIAFEEPKKQDGQSNAVYQEIIPGMTVMFVFFLVNIMAHSFIQEREIGTLRRLRIAPIGATSLLTGKTIPFFIISIVQTVLLFVCGKLVFGMDWGKEPALLIPVIFTTSVAATALGLMVATIVKSDSQVSAYANLVVVGLAGISGCFMPREWLPTIMQEISLYTPHAWALIAYDQLLRKPVPDVLIVVESCAMLFGFGVLFFSIGCLRFSRVE